MKAGWFRAPEWKNYFDLNLSAMTEDAAVARIKDPSFNAVFNEIRHLADAYSKTLMRRQPATDIPEQGDAIRLQWELFHEDLEDKFREPGDGENTLIMYINQPRMTIPGEEGEYFVDGEFRVERVAPLPGEDGRTFLVILRES